MSPPFPFQGFQSTPPRGGRHVNDIIWLLTGPVSIHAPARGATSFVNRPLWTNCCFNPRPRAGGDPDGSARPPKPGGFQSTPPRGGRLAPLDDHVGLGLVSIHAPARGATPGPARGHYRRHGVSIHAPARGATDRHRTSPRSDVRFNPRPRAGGDRQYPGAWPFHNVFQSTPPRGGRPGKAKSEFSQAIVSIHAPARGATFLDVAGPGFKPVFQSTPPRGGRLMTVRHLPSHVFGFNPRPRAGGDTEVDEQTARKMAVSIHAPARGATGWRVPMIQHQHQVSIHAPARGATKKGVTMTIKSYKFQSTPPRGGRRHHPWGFNYVRQVSIHAPARGATGFRG